MPEQKLRLVQAFKATGEMVAMTGDGVNDSWIIATSVLQGVGVLVGVALLYASVLEAGTPEPQARAMAFAAIVFGNVELILATRSRQATLVETLRRRNAALWWILGGATLGLALALCVEPIAGFSVLQPRAVSAVAMFGCCRTQFDMAVAVKVASSLRHPAARSVRAHPRIDDANARSGFTSFGFPSKAGARSLRRLTRV